ncbi:MAG TPA: ADP-ribosylglycohydrolase family protein [Chitinophagales bacterium]|nr:ADP-ribosylglycohydrolase family protein [Chitinophagales bacterium]
MERNKGRDILFGLAVGDALGVPVEFRSRKAIALNPVKSMLGHGTHNQPAGTWSDDSSLAFCLAEALTNEFDLKNAAENFVAWMNDSYWTPHGSVFDIGITTRTAINELAMGIRPELAGGFDINSNGNGSLMRILPLILFLKDKPIEERYEWVKKVSSITHAHIRSVIGCFYYTEFALLLLNGSKPNNAYKSLQLTLPVFLLDILEINPAEVTLYDRLLTQDIIQLKEDEIFSSGYVLHTLEASIWCILTTNTYADAVLKAVNLGDDTDTTGCVTGGLAGIVYGYDEIPTEWISVLARKADIQDLANRLNEKHKS